MTKKQLLIATQNSGKIEEIKAILKDVPLQLKTLNDVGFIGEIPETGKSFAENAILKAKTVGEKSDLLTLAEDSGLEVDALDGRPGIYSARYKRGSDSDRINKLLKELIGVPKEKRTARFKAVVAIYFPRSVIPTNPEGRVEGSLSHERFLDSFTLKNPAGFFSARNDNYYRIFTFEGVSEGYITDYPMGDNGFGYDPVFFNFDLGKTNAQASLEEKSKVSHRAKALLKAVAKIRMVYFQRNS